MTYFQKKINLENDQSWIYFNKIAKDYEYLDSRLCKSNLIWWKKTLLDEGWTIEDMSFCLLDAEEPYFIFMGFSMIRNNNKKLFLLYIPCFILENIELNYQKKRNIKNALSKLLNENEIPISISSNSVNHLNSYSMDYLITNYFFKIKPSLSTEILIYKSEDQLWNEIRKGYKSLINWGLRELEIIIYTKENINLDIIEDFRKLHFEEAGRETRSRESWLLQYEAVLEDEAFVICAKLNGVLVSGSYFIIKNKHCYYGSSASKFLQTGKPLMHSVIWSAILECKKRDISFFETGQQFSKAEIMQNNIDKKNLNIALFKSGFGGRIHNKFFLEN